MRARMNGERRLHRDLEGKNEVTYMKNDENANQKKEKKREKIVKNMTAFLIKKRERSSTR